MNMDVVSLGYRTDLALLEIGGSTIDDRGDHLVVRSPYNPTFYWGNFLLLDHVPAAADAQEWVDRFAAEFPGAKHVAIGIDGRSGTPEDLQPLVDLGMKREVNAVMTAQSVYPPPRPNTEATYRALDSDADWEAQVEVRMAVDADEVEDLDAHRTFVVARAATARQLSEEGHGAWFGAFLDGRLVSTMGLVRADSGLARFQNVETHPEARGRGLAGTLVHHVSEYGFTELGATTLVMVADPEYLAIRVYRSVGFEATESQLQVQRT
jgi:ribosomal protein S18 acetylase RimI-like enzyme